MENKSTNIQIILSGKFQPFSAEPKKILEITTIFNAFHLFPKEVTEQRIEFTANQGQNITLIKSLELVSANQQTVLQVRPDMLVFNSNTDADTTLTALFKMFIDLLNKIEKMIEFDKAFRLGVVQTKQDLNGDIQDYKNKNKLANEIIEHRNRVVYRQTLNDIAELVNYVESSDFISKDAGAPQNILSYSFDINTLSDKDAPRFNINDINNFLNGAKNILKG